MCMLNSNKRISGEQLPNVFPAAIKTPALRRGWFLGQLSGSSHRFLMEVAQLTAEITMPS